MKASTVNKVFAALSLLVIMGESALLGADLYSKNTHGIIPDVALIVLWLVILMFNLSVIISDVEDEVRRKIALDDLKKTVNDVVRKIKESEDRDFDSDPLSRKFKDIYDKEVGKKKPTQRQLMAIKAEFESTTGHEVILTKNKFGLEIKINKNPINKEDK